MGDRSLAGRTLIGLWCAVALSIVACTPTSEPSVPTVQPSDGRLDVHVLVTPPKDVANFKQGDTTHVDFAWVTHPHEADDYYGPNEAFRKHLTETPLSWKTTHREVAGNDLKVTAQGGDVLANYPIEVAATQDDVKVTIEGGVGFVPITFSRLTDHAGYAIYQVVDGKHVALDQSSYGNDFWQTDYDAASQTYSLTYNLPLDGLKTSTWILKK